MKRMSKIVLVICSMLLLSACGSANSGNEDREQNTVDYSEKEDTDKKEEESVTIKTSPDKYTWYIKDYVGKNVASFGYTSMGGDRMDTYGAGYLRLILVNEQGSYIDIDDENEMKNYVVVNQNIPPNTEMKYIFQKDEAGNELDALLESQSYEEIVLAVGKVGDEESKERKLTEIYPSPDKYTNYIRDYVGRNLADCGYISLGGDFRDAYSGGTIRFVIMADDGSYVDISDETLRKYVVTGQNLEPNTELKLEYSKDESGAEYSNLVESQNISEIELYVSMIEN